MLAKAVYTSSMIIFLILGLIVGAGMVVFVLQNIEPASVAFLTWQLDGSLAVILMLAFGMGVLMTLLFLLPSFIRDEWHYRKLKKHVHATEEELAQTKRLMNAPLPQPTLKDTTPPPSA
jgi:uncharacterized integral membrane protein